MWLLLLRSGIVSTSPYYQARGAPLVCSPRLFIQHIYNYSLYLELVSFTPILRTRHAVVTRIPLSFHLYKNTKLYCNINTTGISIYSIKQYMFPSYFIFLVSHPLWGKYPLLSTITSHTYLNSTQAGDFFREQLFVIYKLPGILQMWYGVQYTE